MSAALQKLADRPESLAQLVYGTIRAAIINKTLTPGRPISETGLDRSIAVSTMPVRQAILQLREIRND